MVMSIDGKVSDVKKKALAKEISSIRHYFHSMEEFNAICLKAYKNLFEEPIPSGPSTGHYS